MKPTVLKHKIKIMNPTYASNEDFGGQILKQVSEWEEIWPLFAAYRDLSGREYFEAKKTNSELTGEFKVRYRADLTGLKATPYKIVWGERIFNITAVRDIDGDKMWLYINVEEIIDPSKDVAAEPDTERSSGV